MALDPNIILRGTSVQPLDPVSTMTNALAVRGALTNQRYAEEDRARTNALRQATVLKEDGSIDEPATLNALRGLTTPAEAQSLQHQWGSDRLARQKADAEAKKAQFEQAMQRSKYVSERLAALGPNPPLDAVHALVAEFRANKIDVPDSEIPMSQEQVPAAMQRAMREALGAKETLAAQRAELEQQWKMVQPQSEVGKIMHDQANYVAGGGRFTPPANFLAGNPAASGPTDVGAPPGGVVKPYTKTVPKPEPDVQTVPMEAKARNPFDVAVANATRKPPEGFRWNDNLTDYVPIEAYWKEKRKAEGGSIKDANSIRDDFTKASKDFILTRDAYTRVKESAQNPSAAGDLSLIFGFMRMLDPTSTVREGEFATAQNAAGVPDRVRNYYNRVMSGERLADTQRADFVSRADSLYQGALRNHTKVEGQYTDIARRAGLDPRDVVISYREMSPDQPRTGADKPSTPPLTATNPKTGERIRSTDGGKTWQPVK